MSSKFSSGYVDLPLLGEFHVEWCAAPRGRHWLDAAMGNLNLELFAGNLHLIWSAEPKGLAVFTFMLGWLMDPPLTIIHTAAAAICNFCP